MLLPSLRQLSPGSIRELTALPLPEQRIHSEEDVETWRTTQGYKDYTLFIRRLNESVVGVYAPPNNPSEPITKTLAILDLLDGWIDQIPPLVSPQRFGNLAFRQWGERLHRETPALLESLLPPHLHPSIPHISPYLLSSFGSFGRMDYGTGHEAAFALWLMCLALIGFFTPDDETALVLHVFTRYSTLCWRLQDVYRLEPAGSHGVWGLDDSSFLAYVFGSAQLRDQTKIPVSSFLSIRNSDPPTTPKEILTQEQDPQNNLFFASIRRIHVVKTGPFHEHSSQLHNIGRGVANWHKVHEGLMKMYNAEVLGKRVVVQHIPLGGLLIWDPPQSSSTSTAHHRTPPSTTTTLPPSNDPPLTRAPWTPVAAPTMSSAAAAVWTSAPVRAPWAASTYTPTATGIPTTTTAAPWSSNDGRRGNRTEESSGYVPMGNQR